MISESMPRLPYQVITPDRVAIFSCYNTINSKWHDWEPHPELLAAMPPLRRSLFRGVYAQRNAVGGQYG